MVGPTRLILADDHTVLRQGVRELLRAQPDFEVVGEAATAQEAVEVVQRVMPDVVIMDLRMPDISGIEATRLIRQHHPGVRVIALSSACDPATVTETMAAGASAFVAKLSAFEELLTAIRAVLAGGRYFSPGIEPSADANGNGCCELTVREREVLMLLAGGNTTKGAALSLSLSAKTIETHRRNLMRKLDIDNLADLTKYAIRTGLTSDT